LTSTLYFRPAARTMKIVKPDLKLASDVPGDCGVYVFYVPGIVKYEDLKKTLEEWGGGTGKNFFVGNWSLDAPDLKKVLTNFKINKSPAIVISGPPTISTTAKDPKSTAYARIDNKHVLTDKEKAVDIIGATCNLFLENKVKEAVTAARNDGYKTTLNYYLGRISSKISDFLNTHKVTFDIAKGQIIVAPSDTSEKSK